MVLSESVRSNRASKTLTRTLFLRDMLQTFSRYLMLLKFFAASSSRRSADHQPNIKKLNCWKIVEVRENPAQQTRWKSETKSWRAGSGRSAMSDDKSIIPDKLWIRVIC